MLKTFQCKYCRKPIQVNVQRVDSNPDATHLSCTAKVIMAAKVLRDIKDTMDKRLHEEGRALCRI